MSDQNKYINAYVDHAVGMLHENLTTVLQLKSQLRVANELVVEKEKTISSLQSELDQSKSSLTDKNSAIQNAQKWEADYNAMKNKVSHMDTLLHQMNDMKKTIIDKDASYNSMVIAKDETYKKIIAEKDAEIELLKTKIASLQSLKKTINRKKPIVENTPVVLPKESLTTVVPIVHEQPRETDDF